MTKSSLLLFKLIRTRLILGMSAMLILFFCLARFNLQISIGYPVFLLFVGLILTNLLNLPAFLNRMTFFPVTDRQVAWIPMAVWGGLFLSGTLGVILGQWFGFTTGVISFNETPLIHFSSIQVVPFVFFLLLLLQRTQIIDTGMVFALICFAVIIMDSVIFKNSIIEIENTPPEWMLFGHTVWPLWILGSLLLIWEAPQKTAALRQVEFQESETALGNNRRIPNTSGPFHRTWVTTLVDTGTGTLVALIFGTGMVYMTLDAFFLHQIVEKNIYTLVMGLGSLLFLIFFLIKTWNQNRASGMSRSRATIILLIEIPGVGYGMRDWLGVSRGTICHCRSCRNLRLVWHRVCPHCANRSISAKPRSQEEKRKKSWLSQLWPEHDPEALAFRVIGSLSVVAMILACNWQHWFGN